MVQGNLKFLWVNIFILQIRKQRSREPLGFAEGHIAT